MMRWYRVCLLSWVALIGCDEIRVWPNADEFEAQLRCGMPEADVASTAVALGAPEPDRRVGPDGDIQRVFMKNGTVFSVFLERGRVVSYERRQYKGMTNLEVGPKTNLCTGERSGHVHLIVVTSNTDYAGAVVMIDGREAALLSNGPSIRADVNIWSGRHEVDIVRVGQPRIKKVLVINPDTKEHTLSFQ